MRLPKMYLKVTHEVTHDEIEVTHEVTHDKIEVTHEVTQIRH
jgi:hypothetical protein